MDFKKPRFKILFIAGFTMILMACNQTSYEVHTIDLGEIREIAAPTALPPATGGHIVWLSVKDAVNMNPHIANDTSSLVFQSQVFEGLFKLDEKDGLVPMLAESYYFTEPNIWRFNLRQGVYFHDGTPFNAEAVYANFNSLRYLDDTYLLEIVTDIVIADRYTIYMYAVSPSDFLPEYLAYNTNFLISSPVALKSDGMIEAGVYLGTGPFVMSSRTPEDNTVFIRNENYWWELPCIESLTIRIVSDSAEGIGMLNTGEANGFTVTSEEIPSIRRSGFVRYFELPYCEEYYVQLVAAYTGITGLSMENGAVPNFTNVTVQTRLRICGLSSVPCPSTCPYGGVS